MKNVKKNTMVFGAVVIALLMVSSATAVNVPPADESKELEAENIENEFFSSTEVILTYVDIPELENALDMLDDTEEREALQAIIIFVMNNGQITMNELDELLGPFNLRLRIYRGQVDGQSSPCNPPGPMILFHGFFSMPCNFRLSGGTVNDLSAPRRVSWTFFIGHFWYDLQGSIPGRLHTRGVAFGLTIEGSGESEASSVSDLNNPVVDPNPQTQLENQPSSSQQTRLQQFKQVLLNLIYNIKLRYQTANI